MSTQITLPLSERSVELEILLLRAFHVHNVDHVVVRLEVFMGGVLFVQVFVQVADERELIANRKRSNVLHHNCG